MKTFDPGSASPCGDMRVLLSGLLDHELDQETERIVAEHLRICASCRKEHHELESFSGELRAAGRRIPAPPAWETIARSLAPGTTDGLAPSRTTKSPEASSSAQHDLAREALDRTPAPRLARPRFTLVAAAALALVSIVGGAAYRSAHIAAPTSSSPFALPSDLIHQFVDPGRQPDFSRLGTVRAVSREQLREGPRQLSFTPLTPETLPGGYLFESGCVITSNVCRMVYTRYRREGRVLALFQSESRGSAFCDPSSPQCCLIAGMTCRRNRVDSVDLVQTMHGGVALTVAVPAGGADIEALMASLVPAPSIVRE